MFQLSSGTVSIWCNGGGVKGVPSAHSKVEGGCKALHELIENIFFLKEGMEKKKGEKNEQCNYRGQIERPICSCCTEKNIFLP